MPDLLVNSLIRHTDHQIVSEGQACQLPEKLNILLDVREISKTKCRESNLQAHS